MTIGELARRLGVGRETIRYYERFGLSRDPARKGNNYRDYDEKDIQQLSFILRMKRGGFTLSEIRTILARTASASAVGRARIIATLDEKIEALSAEAAAIQAKIDNLTRFRAYLSNADTLSAEEEAMLRTT
jgi:DNA-binding transcriptional MerR regulator